MAFKKKRFRMLSLIVKMLFLGISSGYFKLVIDFCRLVTWKVMHLKKKNQSFLEIQVKERDKGEKCSK